MFLTPGLGLQGARLEGAIRVSALILTITLTLTLNLTLYLSNPIPFYPFSVLFSSFHQLSSQSKSKDLYKYCPTLTPNFQPFLTLQNGLTLSNPFYPFLVLFNSFHQLSSQSKSKNIYKYFLCDFQLFLSFLVFQSCLLI